MLLQPDLLTKSAQNQKTKIFLCGPGLDSTNLNVREKTKEHLTSTPNVSVTYGEHIEEIPGYKNLGTDLQTLEYEFAYSTDFTVLILDSPGAIAELGAFSVTPNVSSRMIVLVPSRFLNSSSYINRGPLSLLARNDLNSVIYYDPADFGLIGNSVRRAVTLYKFLAEDMKWSYQSLLRTLSKQSPYHYTQATNHSRSKFNVAATYATILAIREPTFLDICTGSSMAPDTVKSSLKILFSNNKIRKTSNGTYTPLAGYGDSVLAHFNPTAISKLRCKLAAAA